MNDIDAVVTWVDGRDPVHQQKRAAYLATCGVLPLAAHPTRFDSTDEIEYCLASIQRFAPWFRRIHIVTDGQAPAMLARVRGTAWEGRITVVDHGELFAGFEQYLPTFNSRSIISLLWRIPGLAERFVYFNDDFVLLRPVSATDFFRDDRVVLRGRWRLQSVFSASQWYRRLAGRWSGRGSRNAGAREAQEKAAALAGFTGRYFRLCHAPYPLRRSTLRAFFGEHPALLESNVRHRLRSNEQFKAESLASHLEIARGTAAFDRVARTVQLEPGAGRIGEMLARMRDADTNAQVAFACVQSLDQASPELRREVFAWLDRRVGDVREAAGRARAAAA